MSLTMAIVAGLWYWIGPARPGYTFQQFFCQPLVMALIFGIIHGDVAQAMIIGAGIEMVYVGMVHTGGNISVDECLAGTIAIPLALTLNLDATTGCSFRAVGKSYGSVKTIHQWFFCNES